MYQDDALRLVMITRLGPKDLIRDCEFSSARSGGPGGQNVNKTNSKAVLRFNITRAKCLSEVQKSILFCMLQSRLNHEGELVIHASESRSLQSNREAALVRLAEIITKALAPTKRRRATKVSYSQKRKRLDVKRRNSQKKESRKRVTHET